MGKRARRRARVARLTEAERTFDEIRSIVDDAIRRTVDGAGDDVYCWVRDLTDEWAVYELSGTGVSEPGMYRVTYTVADDDTVTLGEPEKVETEYVPATESDHIEGRVIEAKGTDAAGGRIFRVQILRYGESRNARIYPRRVMETAVPRYEGAKAYDHHRTDQELQTSTIEGLVGTYRNVQAGQTALEGDLHLLPSATHTAEALDASLAAEKASLPPLVGISHDVMARYEPKPGAGGRRVLEAIEILSVNSADVVADPAAGGRAIRMVAGGTGGSNDSKEGQVNLKQLLELLRAADADKRAELLKEHASVLEDNGLTDADVTRMLEPSGDGAGTGGDGNNAGAGDTGAGNNAGDAGAGTGDNGGGNVAELVGAGAATEALHDRSSLIGRQLVSMAVRGAGIDERLTEAVAKRLPEKFTEATLIQHVESFKGLQAELERANLQPTVPAGGGVVKDGLERKVEALDKMFTGEAGGYRSLKEAYCDITGERPKFLDTEDFNRKVLRESLGAGMMPFDSAMRSTESIDTSSWGEILGDSITRRVVAEHARPNLQVWRQLVSNIFSVPDFRTQRITRLGGYGVLPAVNQGAPYQPLTSPTDEESTYAVTKRGGTEDLTLETITNDDLRQVQLIPKKLGLAAGQTLYRFVFDLLASNPTLTYDSVALFAAGHANTDTSAALAQATLSAGRKKMRKQASYGDSSDILSIVPKYLLVPSDLEELAFQLCTSAVALGVNAGSAAGANVSNIPNIHQGLEPIVVDYWSDTNDWFLEADPAMHPTIEIGFLQGRQDPELFVQNDENVGSVFTADKITYKIRHIYSGTVLDHRGFYRGQG